LLRALVARSYELVRHDIPKMPAQADFEVLSKSVDSSEEFAKLFGIASIKDYSAASALHPLTATKLGLALGGKGWHKANQLIDKVKQEKGIDLKTSDNRYHRAEKLNKTILHKYSKDMLELLKRVRDGVEYDIDM
jgi:hypothetical protein